MATQRKSKKTTAGRAKKNPLDRMRARLRRVNREIRSKDEFLSNAVHEIRSPMTVIHSVLKLAQTGGLGTFDPKAEQLMAIAYRNSERIVRTIENILDLSRLESHRAHPRPMRLGAATVIAEAVSDLRLMLPDEHEKIQVEVHNHNPDIYVDYDMIMQVLHNIIGNSIRFARENVEVKVYSRGKKVLVEVRDDGPGIPAGMESKLFKRFGQAERRGVGYKGTGLGLVICRELVELNGGTIEGGNAPDGGALFTIALPVPPEAMPEEAL